MWSSRQGDHTISKYKGNQMSPKRLKNGITKSFPVQISRILLNPLLFGGLNRPPPYPCLVCFQTLVTALMQYCSVELSLSIYGGLLTATAVRVNPGIPQFNLQFSFFFLSNSGVLLLRIIRVIYYFTERVTFLRVIIPI